MKNQRVAIVNASRTPIGKFGGILKNLSAPNLGACVISDVSKTASPNVIQIDEVIFGNVFQAGNGPNPARIASLKAGLPVSIPSMTINKVCGSGLKSIILAAQSIALGEANSIVAGGMESMSTSPYLVEKVRWGAHSGHKQLTDTIMSDGLWDPVIKCYMGNTAENLAQKYEVSREDQDLFALHSQMRYQNALTNRKFDSQIIPISVSQDSAPPILMRNDEPPRPDTTIDSLAGLMPSFIQNGTVTAGNSSPLSDGAAAVLVMSQNQVAAFDLKPLAWIEGYVSIGVDPSIMGIGPALAIRKLLEKHNLTLSDIDLMEINEAFAGQIISVAKELKWETSRLNINGGAIAMGHPLGASGARIVVTLLHEMKRQNSKYGLAALCVGGGMGIAILLRNG